MLHICSIVQIMYENYSAFYNCIIKDSDMLMVWCKFARDLKKIWIAVCVCLFKSSSTELAVLASRPVVGSSKKRTDGSMISSIPILVLFLSPPEIPRMSCVPTCRNTHTVSCFRLSLLLHIVLIFLNNVGEICHNMQHLLTCWQWADKNGSSKMELSTIIGWGTCRVKKRNTSGKKHWKVSYDTKISVSHPVACRTPSKRWR